MTQFKMPGLTPKSPKTSFLIVILFFAVIIGLVYLNEYNNRVNFARNALTENDWKTCADKINSVNFEDCWNYFHGAGKEFKDTNALDTGIFGEPFYGAPQVQKHTIWQDIGNFFTQAITGVTS